MKYYRWEKPQYLTPTKLQSFLLYIFIFLSFYEGYLNQIIGSYTKYYLILIILIFAASYKKIKFEYYHMLFIFWLIFKFLSIFWGAGSFYSSTNVSTHFLSQVGMVSFLLIMTIVNFDRNFIKTLLNVSYYTSVSMGVLALFFAEPYLFAVESRRVLTILGQQIDPNNLAAFYLVGISIGLYFAFFESKRVALNLVFVGINSFALFLTASRGGIVSFLAIVLCILLLSKDHRNQGTTWVRRVLYLITAMAAIVSFGYRFLPQNIINRIVDLGAYEYGSGRGELWTTAWSLISQKPLFGWGWGGYESGIHNTYLSMLCDVGIVGTSLFVIPIIIICWRALKKKIPVAIILLVTGLAPSFFIDAINKRFFWSAIVLAIMIINSKNSPQGSSKVMRRLN